MATAPAIPERLKGAAERLAVGPADAVLELGCGNGVLAALIAPQLARGHYLGLDRSSSAIAKAVWRNADAVASGALSFRLGEIAKAEPGERYDRIVAVNLNAFWNSDAAELARMRGWLAPRGRLLLAFQPPSATALPRIETAVREHLLRHGYALQTVERVATAAVPTLYLTAVAG